MSVLAGGGVYIHPTPGINLKPCLATFSTSLSFCEAAFFFALSFADEGDWQLVNTGRHTPRANKAISVGFIAATLRLTGSGVNTESLFLPRKKEGGVYTSNPRWGVVALRGILLI